MKRLIIIVSVIFATIPLCAQKSVENDAVFVTVGANVPMYKNIEGDVVLGLHYAHYYSNGVGFRTGFQYIPTVVDIDNSFSLPLAISYRTGSRSRSQKLTSAANSVAQTQTSCDGLFLSDQTGGAVDLTLCDSNGIPFDMGSEYPIKCPEMVTSYVLASIVNERRRLLCNMMHKEGFANYPGEWWHFSYGDQLWAAYRYKRYAIYGVINKIR